MSPTHLEAARRYTFVRHLHDGGQGSASLAVDVQTGAHVVLKRLHMERLEDWKHVELFEREAGVLQRLNHPSIPAYIDAFHEEQSATNSFQLVLVQQYIEGIDLERALSDGSLRMNEALAQKLANEVLDILAYLHSHAPPIIHRDIKPANLIRNADGRLFLVDFGAVQEIASSASGGSTIVGTVGYIAPEQMSGHATPASDLYSLGATLIRLLTGRNLHELPMRRMRLEFRSFANVSPAFASFLDRLIAPEHEDRPQNAIEALHYLHALDAPQQQLSLPDHSTNAELNNPHLTVEQSPEQLQAVLKFNPITVNVGLAIGAISLIFFALIILFIGLTLPIFIVTAFTPALLFMLVSTAEFTTTLTLDSHYFSITTSIFGYQAVKKIASHEFGGFKLVHTPLQKFEFEFEYLEVLFNDGARPFGLQLTSNERKWLMSLFDRKSPVVQNLLEASPNTPRSAIFSSRLNR